MASEFSVVTQSHVTLTIQTEGKEYGVEKRYAKDILIGDFKNKLEMITGLVASDMKLRLLSREKKFVCEMEPNDRMLGYFPVEDGGVVQVSGSKTVLEFDDTSAVKKFELSEEEYARRKNTLKEFKEKNKLGRFGDEKQDLAQKKEEQAKLKIEAEKKAIETMSVNSRCEVRIPGASTRLGTVMYLGELVGKAGYFVGVKYDEPLGKNDGSVDGKRYFQCAPNYGGFVKPEFVTVGDFPEENLDEL